MRALLALLASISIAIAGIADVAWAGSARPTTLELSVLLATHGDAGTSIDPQLRELPQLTRDEPFVRYDVYRLIDRRAFALETGKPVSCALVNGRTVRATLQGKSDDAGPRRYQIAVQIAEPGKKDYLRTLTVTASENQPFFVGGQAYRG